MSQDRYIIAGFSVPMRVDPEPPDTPMTARVFYWNGFAWTLEEEKARPYIHTDSLKYWLGKLRAKRAKAWPFLVRIVAGKLDPVGTTVVLPGEAPAPVPPAEGEK